MNENETRKCPKYGAKMKQRIRLLATPGLQCEF